MTRFHIGESIVRTGGYFTLRLQGLDSQAGGPIVSESAPGERSHFMDHERGPDSSGHLAKLEREETKLWRASVLFLALLAIALGFTSWETFRSIPQHLEAVPVGTVVLILIFAAYTAQKRKELAELRGQVRGMHQAATAPPSQAQLDQLLQILQNSQKSYRDLVDSFEDVVFAMSLTGTIRTANRAFADRKSVV